MKSAKRQTLDQIMTALDRPTLVQCLAHVQRRRARDALLERLLETRLTSLVSAPAASNGHDMLLTVPEVAKRLRLRKARVYELVRARMLPKVPGLGTQIRIPASALTGSQAQKMA
jgi:excisionase family DNA binding protein